jgi:hypothetical protein
MPVVLYGRETWSITSGEEHRLRVFEYRVLRRIFGPKRDGKGEWRKLHSRELHNLYSSPNIIRQMKSRRKRWAQRVARRGEGRNVYRVLAEIARGVAGSLGLELILGRLAGGGGGRPFVRVCVRVCVCVCVELIHLAEFRAWWLAVLYIVVNPWVMVPRS